MFGIFLFPFLTLLHGDKEQKTSSHTNHYYSKDFFFNSVSLHLFTVSFLGPPLPPVNGWVVKGI